jgi:hypothetical protein
MKIQSLHIQNFTVFEDQEFDFCDGVNVFIGANATGKTHALKALYCVTLSVGYGSPLLSGENQEPLRTFLSDAFRPENRDHSRLLRHDEGDRRYEIDAKGRLTNGRPWDMGLSSLPRELSSRGIDSGGCSVSSMHQPEKVVFIPPREMLSAYEGFAASWERRELSFDKTYYDICRHLEPLALKKEKLTREASDLISDLTDILGGSVIEKGGRFYVKQPTGKLLEAHLLAEGHRKLAMLVRLIANGEIEKDTVLLWDEPESGLNPRIITLVAQAIRQLAAAGVQVFLATHDYLLTGELSLAAEYEKGGPSIRFFAFHRENAQEPVSVEAGGTITDLQHNPIIEEFAAHYDRERNAFYRKAQAEG